MLFAFNPKASPYMVNASKTFTYHLLGKLLSQALDLQLCEIPSLFLKGFRHSRNLLLLSGIKKER